MQRRPENSGELSLLEMARIFSIKYLQHQALSTTSFILKNKQAPTLWSYKYHGALGGDAERSEKQVKQESERSPPARVLQGTAVPRSSIVAQVWLKRCGKSCRLRWMNYLRPGIKRGNISGDEEELIIRMHKLLGNRWALIAGRLPGRTDNEIKNYWNSYLAKKMKDQLPLPKPRTEKKPIFRLENENKVAMEPPTDTDLVKNKSSTSELSAGLPQSTTREDKEEDLMLDLNSEDLFRILDSDFGKLNDVHMNELNPNVEGNICPFLPSGGIEDSSHGNECGQDNNKMVSDMGSLLLDSDEGWLGDDIDILFSD